MDFEIRCAHWLTRGGQAATLACLLIAADGLAAVLALPRIDSAPSLITREGRAGGHKTCLQATEQQPLSAAVLRVESDGRHACGRSRSLPPGFQ